MGQTQSGLDPTTDQPFQPSSGMGSNVPFQPHGNINGHMYGSNLYGTGGLQPRRSQDLDISNSSLQQISATDLLRDFETEKAMEEMRQQLNRGATAPRMSPTYRQTEDVPYSARSSYSRYPPAPPPHHRGMEEHRRKPPQARFEPPTRFEPPPSRHLSPLNQSSSSRHHGSLAQSASSLPSTGNLEGLVMHILNEMPLQSHVRTYFEGALEQAKAMVQGLQTQNGELKRNLDLKNMEVSGFRQRIDELETLLQKKPAVVEIPVIPAVNIKDIEAAAQRESAAKKMLQTERQRWEMMREELQLDRDAERIRVTELEEEIKNLRDLVSELEEETQRPDPVLEDELLTLRRRLAMLRAEHNALQIESVTEPAVVERLQRQVRELENMLQQSDAELVKAKSAKSERVTGNLLRKKDEKIMNLEAELTRIRGLLRDVEMSRRKEERGVENLNPNERGGDGEASEREAAVLARLAEKEREIEGLHTVIRNSERQRVADATVTALAQNSTDGISLQEKLGEKNREIAKLQRELYEMEMSLNTVKTQLALSAAQTAERRSDDGKQSENAMRDNMRTELRDAENEIRHLREELRDRENQIHDLSLRIQRDEQIIRELRENRGGPSLGSLDSNYQQTVAEHVAALEDRLYKEQQKSQLLDMEHAEMQHQLNDISQKYHALLQNSKSQPKERRHDSAGGVGFDQWR